MDAVATLVRSIFQKDSLHDCTVEELESLTREYPYFTPAHFLLAQKLRSIDENLYREQLQKLSLHFSNPLWLDYLLNGYGDVSVIEPDNKSETLEAPPPVIEETPMSPIEQTQEIQAEQTFIKSEPEIVEPIKVEVIEQANADLEIRHDDIVEINRSIEPLPEENVADGTVDVPESVEQPIEPQNEYSEEQPKETFTEEAPDLSEASTHPDEERESEPLAIPSLPDLQKEPTETELTFEPYHTVDYFASQGIKFVPEEKPSDRFGQQLKSFTEWLKTMKRLPHTEITKTTDVSAEEKIQRLADHSITEGDIVTEAMADVWAKQGNKEKAIEIYNKLSLLNPDKSAYFASLIDQLKNS
jgi:hypothetical protein